MAFKMKNTSMAKLAKEAGNNRVSPIKDRLPTPAEDKALLAKVEKEKISTDAGNKDQIKKVKGTLENPAEKLEICLEKKLDKKLELIEKKLELKEKKLEKELEKTRVRRLLAKALISVVARVYLELFLLKRKRSRTWQLKDIKSFLSILLVLLRLQKEKVELMKNKN